MNLLFALLVLGRALMLAAISVTPSSRRILFVFSFQVLFKL